MLYFTECTPRAAVRLAGRAALVAALALCAREAVGQVGRPPASPSRGDSLPLFDARMIYDDRIRQRFPQLTAYDLDSGACRFTALAHDTAVAEAIRRAFLPLVTGRPGPQCPGEVMVVHFPFSRAELSSFQARIGSLLQGSATGAWTYFNTRRGRIVVEVKNIPSVARAEALLFSDLSLPRDLIAIEPRSQRREAENPQLPPPEAYIAVLTHEYRRWIGTGSSLGLSRENLPDTFGPEHLHELPIALTDDRCAPLILIRFEPPRQLEDGAYWLEVFASPTNSWTSPTTYDVRCDEGECFIVRIRSSIADYIGRLCR